MRFGSSSLLDMDEWNDRISMDHIANVMCAVNALSRRSRLPAFAKRRVAANDFGCVRHGEWIVGEAG